MEFSAIYGKIRLANKEKANVGSIRNLLASYRGSVVILKAPAHLIP